MPQDILPNPTNVQTSNPYLGLDRGLFKYRSPGMERLARIHAATWTLQGPGASVGVLSYQIMTYNSTPVTEQQYAAGNLVDAPDGTPWFDVLTKGLVMDPIIAEYWGTQGYFGVYISGNGEKLTDDEKQANNDQANVFAKAMGKVVGLTDILCTVTFAATNGKPLSRTDTTLSFDYTDKNNATQHIDMTASDLPVVTFDPVLVAIKKIQSLG